MIPVSGESTEQPLISVVVTCFNESDFIVPTISDLVQALESMVPVWEIILFDDASTDDSNDMIQIYLNKFPNKPIIYFRRPHNVGFVGNVLEGAKISRGKYFWIVGGDHTVPADAMKALLGQLGNADIIIPDVQKHQGKGVFRRLLSRTYSGLIRIISGSKIKYFNGSSLFLREDFVRELSSIHGFSYSAEIILRLVGAGKTYVEVPVIYRENENKRSTALSWKHLFEVAIFFSRLLWTRITLIRLSLIKQQG